MLFTLLACGIESVPPKDGGVDVSADWSCDSTGTYGPRQLRLLSRREYQNSILDLFNAREEEPCTYTFSLADAGYQSVAVAGSFNDWSSSMWPLQLSGTTWSLTTELDPGEYQYKFVVDGSIWLADPANPETVDDGYGGQNSVLHQSCGITDTSWLTSLDLISSLPPEGRPAEFAFDNYAASGLVSPSHMDVYLNNAEAIAAAVDIEALVGCELEEPACTEAWVQSFGRRAWRRALNEEQVSRLLSVIDEAETPEAGVQLALSAILASPYFVYRLELGTAVGDGTYKLSGYELASALSYFYWGSLPDEAGLSAAESGLLETEAGLEQESSRLLADAKAHDTIRAFALAWLGVESLKTSVKSTVYFPDFDQTVREAMLKEAADFVEGRVFMEDGMFPTLLQGDPIRADLAGWYGDSGARSAGILGLGAVAATYAHSDQTAPIQRGLFVRRVLLCQEFGTPPANAGTVPVVDPTATTRERFAQHTADPNCLACHQYIDNVGFGMENLDAVGRWREEENGFVIDSSGDMNDIEFLGQGNSNPFEGVEELSGLLQASDQAPACFSVQWMRFALGWQPESDEICAYDAIREQFLADNQNIQALLLAIPKTTPFLYREDP